MDKLPANAVLLLIDVQKGFDEPVWGQRNNPGAEENMARLLAAWRASNRPIIFVKHLSKYPDSPLNKDNPGCAIKEIVKPRAGELIVWKHVNSAFIGTNLEKELNSKGYNTLVIVGLTTQHCVSTTARMAGNLDYHTYVVSDATAAFGLTGPDGIDYSAETVHALSLATIHNEFAQVVDTGTIMKAL
jgi:nicotinamidase-related amidase